MLLKRPIQTRFRYGSVLSKLNLATYNNSLAHYAKGTWLRITYTALPPLVDNWFQFLFHSPSGVLFTFPSRYLFTIGHQLVFSLTQWSGQIPTEFHVLCSTREIVTWLAYFSLTRLSLSLATLSRVFN